MSKIKKKSKATQSNTKKKRSTYKSVRQTMQEVSIQTKNLNTRQTNRKVPRKMKNRSPLQTNSKVPRKT